MQLGLSPLRVAAPSSTPVKEMLIGALLYGSTLYFSSNMLLLIPLLLLAMGAVRFRGRMSLALVGAFSLLALLNVLFNLGTFDPERHGSSLAVILVAAIALWAPSLPDRALKVFVVATCLEVLVGALEYQMGQVALTAAQVGLSDQALTQDSVYLYDLRVFGLSANSSLLAEKVFISILLTLAIPDLFRRRWLPLSLLALGLYLSFNRTAIACTLLFLLLSVRREHLSGLRLVLGLGASLAGLMAVAFNLEELVLQFTRGNAEDLSHSELSRLYFWAKSLELISENPFFGNGSLTFRVEDFVTGLPQHTHNSFLMLAATHGLIPAVLLLTYVALNINGFNWRMIVAMLAFSLTQYFVFWNLSVPDMIFFWLLGQRLVRPRKALQPCPVPDREPVRQQPCASPVAVT
jgi:O-Antigen ligase